MVDPQIVVLVVAGSSPVGHPTSFFWIQISGIISVQLAISPVRNCSGNSDFKVALLFPFFAPAFAILHNLWCAL